MREKLQPAFHARKVGEYARIILDETRRMMTSWDNEMYKPGEIMIPDVFRSVSDMTYRVTCRALLERDPDDKEAALVHRVMVDTVKLMSMGVRFPLFFRLTKLLSVASSTRRGLRQIDEIIKGIIKEAHYEEQNSFLSLLSSDKESGVFGPNCAKHRFAKDNIMAL